MKLKYDWSGFTKENYDKMIKEANGETFWRVGRDYFGCVRVGELCFDIMLYYDDSLGDEHFQADLDCYVPYEDTGYGYKTLDDGTEIAYDEADGTAVYDLTSYDNLKIDAEMAIEEHIKWYDGLDGHTYKLSDKANKELLIW